MDQDRALGGVADILENRDQVIQIMPVDRADIIEAELLEQGAAGEEGAGEFLSLSCGFMQESWQLADHRLGRFAGAAIDGA
ncbi:hypothetical protein D3C71_2113870 [compost metagenome]